MAFLLFLGKVAITCAIGEYGIHNIAIMYKECSMTAFSANNIIYRCSQVCWPTLVLVATLDSVRPSGTSHSTTTLFQSL